MHAIAADEHITHSLQPIVEVGDDALRRAVDSDEPLAELDVQASARRLIVHGFVKMSTPDSVADRTIGQRAPEGNGS